MKQNIEALSSDIMIFDPFAPKRCCVVVMFVSDSQSPKSNMAGGAVNRITESDSAEMAGAAEQQ
jgi:hypothetical protein